MEVEQDGVKRQLSGGAQMAVRQGPRPMPSPQGENFQYGGNVIEYAKTHFRTLGPPTKEEERKGAHLEQLQPTTNALSVFAVTGSIQGPQMGTLGVGPFGMSQIVGQPGGFRLA